MRSLPFLGLLAVACSPTDVDEAAFDAVPDAPWEANASAPADPLPPPAPGVGIEGTWLLAGERSTFALFGLQPGDTAYFGLDTDPASYLVGPCYGGSCLDLPSPLFLGSDVANNQGIASVRVRVPAGTPSQTVVHVQAFVERGGVVLTSPVWSDQVQVDADGDGYGDIDCNDSNPTVYPGAVEVCDGVDNDCDNMVDENGGCGTVDADADGFDDTVDCDDSDAAVYPGAYEVCDGLDNDCDGVADNGCP